VAGLRLAGVAVSGVDRWTRPKSSVLPLQLELEALGEVVELGGHG